MKRQRNCLPLSIVLLSSLLTNTWCHAELVVIVPADCAVQALDNTQIARLFLGKKNRLPTGEIAVPVDQSKGPMRDRFYEAFTGKNRARINEYWAQRLFTGTGAPPLQLATSAEVVNYVANTPHAIGYVDSKMVDQRVKVVATAP